MPMSFGEAPRRGASGRRGRGGSPCPRHLPRPERLLQLRARFAEAARTASLRSRSSAAGPERGPGSPSARLPERPLPGEEEGRGLASRIHAAVPCGQHPLRLLEPRGLPGVEDGTIRPSSRSATQSFHPCTPVSRQIETASSTPRRPAAERSSTPAPAGSCARPRAEDVPRIAVRGHGRAGHHRVGGDVAVLEEAARRVQAAHELRLAPQAHPLRPRGVPGIGRKESTPSGRMGPGRCAGRRCCRPRPRP